MKKFFQSLSTKFFNKLYVFYKLTFTNYLNQPLNKQYTSLTSKLTEDALALGVRFEAAAVQRRTGKISAANFKQMASKIINNFRKVLSEVDTLDGELKRTIAELNSMRGFMYEKKLSDMVAVFQAQLDTVSEHRKTISSILDLILKQVE